MESCLYQVDGSGRVRIVHNLMRDGLTNEWLVANMEVHKERCG